MTQNLEKTKRKYAIIEKVYAFLTPARMFALSFLLLIIIGSIVLHLPFMLKTNVKTPSFIDTVFTVTSAVSASGLSPINIFNTYNVFGQIILIILVQIGGLSFLVLVSYIILKFRKKISLPQRQSIQAAFGVTDASKIKGIVNIAVKGTIIIELICFFVFFFAYLHNGLGVKSALLNGFLQAISVYTNAGLNILSKNGLSYFHDNKIISFFMVIVAEASAIGFIVWLNISTVLKYNKKNFNKRNKILETAPVNKKFFSKLSLHSKLAIITSIVVYFFAIIFFFFAEYNNPLTIGNDSAFNKIFHSILHSSSARYSGEAFLNYFYLNDSTKFISTVLMLIGGGPSGVSGGFKTVTLAVIFCCVFTVMKGKEKIKIFNRTISVSILMQSIAIIAAMITILFAATCLLSIFETANGNYYRVIDLLFETASILTNTGLTVGITSDISFLSKILFVILMYIGRLGPITFVLFLAEKRNKVIDAVNFPEENVLVG